MPRLFPQGRHCTQSSSLANRKLIDKANYWLKNNPEVAVKGCETITWMGSDVTLIKDGDQMVLSKKLVEGAVTVYSRGLRCVEDLKINFRQIFLFMFLFSFKMSMSCCEMSADDAMSCKRSHLGVLPSHLLTHILAIDPLLRHALIKVVLFF